MLELGSFSESNRGAADPFGVPDDGERQSRFGGPVYRRKYEKPVGRLARLALHKMFYQHAAEVIAQLKPDLIVCTHPIPSAIVSYLKLAAGLDVPLCTLITDYDAHGSWMSPGVDRYLVSAPEVKALLVQRGVSPSKVQVTGIPVHPDFWSKQEKTSAREDLGLKQMPTALVMGGGWGLLISEELLAKLAAWREKIQIVCCMGSNEKLAVKLRAHPALQHPNIKVIGFTREIGKWMDASDLLITKPGGMTCTEGMAKGIPMLFFESIPGQEEKNREYFVQRGFGANLDSPDVLTTGLISFTAGTLPSARPIRSRQPGKTAIGPTDAQAPSSACFILQPHRPACACRRPARPSSGPTRSASPNRPPRTSGAHAYASDR
ncbi:hypothetical protein HMSSN139_44050 [Paenibacillus sp. HMSSN-139]|nr:hypothetical protein HMSSN139_44050 [Paenibacillus sp. HMSSN-139]